jgi:hypothetical protein
MPMMFTSCMSKCPLNVNGNKYARAEDDRESQSYTAIYKTT